MSLLCSKCGNTTEFNFGNDSKNILCKECASNAQLIENSNSSKSLNLATLLKATGIVFFVINLIVSAFQLILNLERGMSVIPIIESTFLSVIILLICLGLAKVIEQNYLLLNEGKKDYKG